MYMSDYASKPEVMSINKTAQLIHISKLETIWFIILTD